MALLRHMHSSVVKEHSFKARMQNAPPASVRRWGVGAALGDNGRDYVSRRIGLPCVHLSSVPPTCFRSAGLAALSPRRKPSRAYTSPLAAADAALPARAICARQSRGNEVEVIQVTCMLLQFIRFRFGKQKEPRLGGMAGEMNSPHCRPGDAEHRKPFRPPLGRDSRQAETSVLIGVELRKRVCLRIPTPCHASPHP
jgi:hypothetical protein